jgi:hypothetical protein
VKQNRPFYRRPGCLIALAILAIPGLPIGFVICAVLWFILKPAAYDHADLVRLLSPTGMWTAVVAVDSVNFGMAGDGYDNCDVYLTSKRHPKETDTTELLGFEIDGSADDCARIAWSAPNVLRVTVPNLSSPDIDTLHLDGVSVDLHYDPDDPVARAKWQKTVNEEMKAADQAQ